MAYPDFRKTLAAGFARIIEGRGWAPEVIVGTATAGIAHAAWLADRLALPMAYVRSKPKAHGRGNQVEGRLAAGQRVVVVEDLVSTGMSSVAVVAALRELGVVVEGVVAIFSYGLPVAQQAFEQAEVPLVTLTTFEVLIQEAAAQGTLDDEALASLRAWHEAPALWSEQRQVTAS